jgi:multiple sugar transport system substrate-binding protein
LPVTGNYAILLPLNEFEQLLTFGLQTGEPLLRESGARGNFSSPGFTAALAFYKSLFDERLAPVATNSQISNIWSEFAKGFFSVFISGPWTIGDMKEPAAGQLPTALDDGGHAGAERAGRVGPRRIEPGRIQNGTRSGRRLAAGRLPVRTAGARPSSRP